MFEDRDRQKLNAILSKIADLTETNIAIVAGLNSMIGSVDALRELTARLVDAVATEEGGDLAEEIAKLEAAISGLTAIATEIGQSIHTKIEDIALENGLAVPAPP